MINHTSNLSNRINSKVAPSFLKLNNNKGLKSSKQITAKIKPIKRYKFKNRSKLNFFLLLIVLGLGIFFVIHNFLNSNKALNLDPVGLVMGELTNNQKQLASTDGKISALIFGADMRSDNLTYDLSQIGNTDVILIVSYDINANKVNLISLPRDMGVKFKFPSKTYNWNKITSGVQLGIAGEYPGGGSQLMRDTIYDLTGIKINYTFVVNFKAFSDLINSAGGVDINVENSFCDAGYPTDKNDKVEKVIFYKGIQHMDGILALKFARSRVHDLCKGFTGGDPIFEGTDFRRNYRQQQVISALKNKISQGKITVNQIISLYNALSQNILSEVGDGDFDSSKRIDLATIKSAADNINKYASAEVINFLIDPNACAGQLAREGYIDGSYYLIPLQPNFANLKECLNFNFNNPGIVKENAIIAVYNTMDIQTKAKVISDEVKANYMKSNFYGALFTKSAKSEDGKIITDLSKGNIIIDWNSNNPNTIDYLSKKYSAKVLLKSDISGTLKHLGDADILLLVGN